MGATYHILGFIGKAGEFAGTGSRQVSPKSLLLRAEEG